MKKDKTALVIGATGLVGSELIKQLASDNRYKEVIVFSRRSLDLKDAKIKVHILDFNNMEAQAHLIKGDDVFCCLGTTMRKAGSKEKFYQVDYTYTVNFAKIAAQNGSRQFILVTAMGADTESLFYYSRVKGEAEQNVSQLGFEAVIFCRPSMLLGERTENRLGEEIGKKLMEALDFLIPKKYKAISGSQVAKAMRIIAHRELKGKYIFESDQLLDLE